MPFKSEKQRKWMHANKPKMAKKWEKEEKSVEEDRDYKAEYKKYGSSKKAKKYRAELNQYNRKKGTYGNGDGKDASHKGGKIAGFEKEAINRGRAEKSRLKKESSSEYGKSIEKIANDRKLKSISKKDRAILVKIAKLMKKANESVNEGKKAHKATYDIFGSLRELIHGIKSLRKMIDDGPYNRLNSSVSGGLYKWEIELEKKLRLFTPQLKKVSADKMLESVNEAKSFKPEKRRKLKSGEVEVMKGRGSKQKWFYVKNGDDVKTLVRLGRNYGFPTGIAKNNSKLKFNKSLHLKVKESVNEGKKLSQMNNKELIKHWVKKSKELEVMKSRKKIDKFAYRVESGKIARILNHLWGLQKDMKESVNEAIEPQGNIKKVLDVNKTKTAKKIGGTLVDITTANMMSQVWDKVNDKSKEKMNKMNTRQLTNLILKLWNALGTPRV